MAVHRGAHLLSTGLRLGCSPSRSAFSPRFRVEELDPVKADFYAMGHIPNIIGAIDGTHIAFVPPLKNELLIRNRKSFHSMNVQMVCPADQYISHVNAKDARSVHDAYILRNSSTPYVMAQLQRHRVWLIGDSGYPNLSWLLTPVRNPRTRAEERYNGAHGRTRRIIERTFSLLKAIFRCLHLTSGLLTQEGLPDNPGMLHDLTHQVPFLQEEEAGDDRVAAVDHVDSEDEKVEDKDNRTAVIRQYFQ
ncbi:hypothetical protein NDU88_004190 [Pleurodeles waltl]|uniref:DDE Tnp4 domain-containing protein n=1 Tax=Pleurodeles waltl TaxID=8319 RepID=A0AAV7SI20_PLEWA|nr:hypothetical protein NDU88_004190 [Pleurodeles waltl]